MRSTLIAPQNKFLESILKHSSYSDSNFVIGNARLEHYPIVYCSDNFSKRLGHSRVDIMQKNCTCYFLFGKLTDKSTVSEIEEAIGKQASVIKEIILYKANKKPVWYLLHLSPIKNDENEVVLFLVTFRNISHLKDPIEEDVKAGRFGKLVKKKLAAAAKAEPPTTKSVFVSIAKKPDKKAKQISQIMSVLSDFKPQYSWQTVTTPKYVIVHYSTFKSTWDWIILLFTLYTAVIVPFVVSFGYNNLVLIVFNTLVDMLFMCDLIINFRTTYVNKDGEMITQPREISKNYLRSWFIIDFLSAIPYGLLHFYQDSVWMSEAIGGIKIIRLMRLGRIARRLDRYLEYGATTLILWLLVYCLCAHWMACIWYLIGYKYDTPAKEWGWLHQLSVTTQQAYIFDNGTLRQKSGPSTSSAYMSSLYYCMSSLTTCGFGNIAPTTTAEKLFGCVTMLLGCVLYAFIFGQVTTIIQQFQKASSFYHEKVRQMNEFIKIYSIPRNIGFRLTDYFSSTWSQNKGIDVEQILKLCPRDLQADLCIHMHRKVLENHEAFQGASSSTLRLIARYFWTVRTAPGEVIICSGEFIDCFYFVENGALEIRNKHQILGILGPLDYFGASIDMNAGKEQALYEVSALTYCNLHCIERKAFREVLQLFPDFYEQFSEKLTMTFPLTTKVNISNTKRTFTENNETKVTLVEDTPQKASEENKALDNHSGTRIGSYKKNPVSSKQVVYLDEFDTVEDHAVEALAGSGDMKGEVRTEIERLNAKMGIVEEQIALILKLLQKNEPHSRSQVNLKLAELRAYASVNSEEETWMIESLEDKESMKEEKVKTDVKNKANIANGNEEQETKGNKENIFNTMAAPMVELRAAKIKKKGSINKRKSDISLNTNTQELRIEDKKSDLPPRKKNTVNEDSEM